MDNKQIILPMDSNLEPVITGEMWEDLRFDKAFQQEELDRCYIDPWHWLVNYVYTIRKDDFSPKPEVLRFPAKEHLRYIFHQCFTEPFLAIDKSRQMTMTWVLMAYELYIAQFGEYEEIVCQTKKEKDADEELVQRAAFMWESQPQFLRRPAVYTYCKLQFTENRSKIIGIPKGGDQIRSKNPSRGFIDEGGFLEGEFEECRTAMLACCADIKVVSTANGGEWDAFINDKAAA